MASQITKPSGAVDSPKLLDRIQWARLQAQRREIQPLNLTQSQVDHLVAEWEPLIQPNLTERSEIFAVARPDGETTGVTGPRWLFHCIGLPHRAAYVGLLTPTRLLVLQKRSHCKIDYPYQWHISAAGHVPQTQNGTDISYEDGALKEVAEELFSLDDGGSAREVLTLLDSPLTTIGDPYSTYDEDEARNPPYYNAEVVQLFAGTLSHRGMARLQPQLAEVAGLYLCAADEASYILHHEIVAPGYRTAIPRYLHWLATDSA
jgi:hypothetical protein